MRDYSKIMSSCGVTEYFVTETVTESAQLFFIKKKLDMRRFENTAEAEIGVYKIFEDGGNKYKGYTSVIVNLTDTDEEIAKKVRSAYYGAGFVKNKYYEFAKAAKSPEVVMESDLNGIPLSDIALKFSDAIYEEDCDSKAFINSLEIFSEEKKVHMISSYGTDVSYVKRTVQGEFVAQCKEPNDVETYQDFKYDSLALKEIKTLVKETLSMTRDRALATKMPAAGDYDIVLSDKYVPEIFTFYGARANAGFIYPGYSDYKLGDKVQGSDVKGDKLNVRFGVTSPFDVDGIPMKERPFIEDGVLKTIHGNQRFSYYLGIEQIGSYRKVLLPAGSTGFDELLNRPCLHVVNFSDFQMDPYDGHFKGEIRLAYLHDGKGNVEFVTGGSINGSIFDTQGDLVLSKETQKLANYEGPRAILLKGVAVAGE
ncbi:MAG: hypothetical protein K6E32_07955 [Lachnospiraceae bacterium]|nr:hypothetical protein [Lachnospiraceae bacterium]